MQKLADPVTVMDSGQAGSMELRHQAAYYDGLTDFLPAVLPFVHEGLAGTEPILVMVAGQPGDLLQEELNGDAAGVEFCDMGRLGRNPGRIISAIWDFIGQYPGRALRVLSEPVWPGRSAPEAREALRHEALVNVAFSALPVTVLCPYDVGRLSPAATASVGHTHPLIRTPDGPRPSPDYVSGRLPRAFARSLSRPPAQAESLAYDRDLRAVRALVGRHAERAGLDADRSAGLVLAVGEVTANTLRHTTGGGTAHVWHNRAEILCQVSDQGRISDPLAGRRRPPDVTGLGLWVVNQVCDLVELRTGRHGTTIRMHMLLPGSGLLSPSLPGSGVLGPAGPGSGG